MFRVIFWDKDGETYDRVEHVEQILAGYEGKRSVWYIHTSFTGSNPIILTKSKFPIERIEQEF